MGPNLRKVSNFILVLPTYVLNNFLDIIINTKLNGSQHAHSHCMAYSTFATISAFVVQSGRHGRFGWNAIVEI